MKQWDLRFLTFGTGLSIMPNHLLVCGIPATGKSTFSEWLESHQGFLHLDIDAEYDPARQSPSGSPQRELADQFFSIKSPMSARPFIKGLEGCKKRVVVDWGFPIGCLWLVKELQQREVDVWWFAGDKSAARTAFEKRGTVELKYFDHQMKMIEESWPDIKSVVGSNIIVALDSEGRHRSPEALYEAMLG